MAKDHPTYHLKPAETNLLNFINQHTQAIFSAVLSTIAADRLSYPVTAKTQFKLNPDLTEIELSELPDNNDKPEAAVKAAK